MPTIVETKIATRPTATTPFFNSRVLPGQAYTPYTGAPGGLPEAVFIQPLHAEFAENMASFTSAGRFSSTFTLSEDLLTRTTINTYSDLECYNASENFIDIEFDAAYYSYAVTNNITSPTNGYTQTGINQPFSCTTVYTFNPEDINMFETMIDTLETSFCLESFVNTGTVVTAVHHYADSADFTENHWKDYTYTPYLHAEGVTRSITYAIL